MRRLLVAIACAGLTACASAPLTAPPEAFLALGRVDVPASQKDEAAADAPRDIESDLEAWRKKFHENARLLRSLSWNCRVRYRMPGSFIIHVLYRANTDANGDVQVVEVNRRIERVQGISRVPDAVDATEADQTLAGTLGAMARAYTFPLPGAMDRLLAAENLGAAEAGGGLVLRQMGFLMPEDAVELRLSPSIIEPQTFSFQAQHDGRAVEGKAKYRKLPDGTFYPATVDFILPDTQATVLVENFGFRMQPQMMRDTTE